MSKIELYWSPRGWLGNFVGDAEIEQLFGTTLIPTAYTERASATAVLTGVERLNPGVSVTVGTPWHVLQSVGVAY